MKRSWIKLYLELLDDEKLADLPDEVCWRFVQLLLVAAEKGKGDGELPPLGALAWRIRAKPDEMLVAMQRLEEVGLVRTTPNGWAVNPYLPPRKSDGYLTRRLDWLLVRKKKTAEVFARDGKICVHCGSLDNLTIDHIRPISKGGTDDLSNLQVLFRSCNASKGARFEDSYA